ncbi:ABC transporter ATP-binding protein [Halorarius halobius]|uniref:ABC transporter ATP-binding protein n=1 Tax=Halorarius halobius TaxID=2962671 RepID=UPI0020CF0387|nr:ABC transporter ATP-binding protein [Halorarius halobius]
MAARSVRVAELSKSFEAETALHGIDLDVSPGDITVVVGPSGCGKSTLLKCIAGLVDPSEGSIQFDGTDVTDRRPADRDLGFVFQEFEDTLFAHMTVRENVRVGLEQQSSVDAADIETRIDDILEMVAVSDLGDDYPENLSGGQQQRVELARQLARDCDLVLLDDPLADLDYKLQKRMELELHRRHAASNNTYLYVTHNQTQALELADELVVMNAGRIEQVGTPASVYHDPETAFVGRFVGDSNMIEGVRDGTEGAISTDAGELVAADAGAGSEEVVVLVRPEEIELQPDPDAVDNTLEGRVQGRTFIGDETEFIVSVPGIEDTVLVRLPGSVTVDADEVTIGWDADATLVYGLDELSVDPDFALADLRELYS